MFFKTVKMPKKGKFPWKVTIFAQHVNNTHTHHMKKEFYKNQIF
jgi:hypothetical protein